MCLIHIKHYCYTEAGQLKYNLRKKHSDRAFSSFFILIGITINVVIAYITNRLSLPIYLDTIGTFMVSALGGYFPGILTAVMTNMIYGVLPL